MNFQQSAILNRLWASMQNNSPVTQVDQKYSPGIMDSYLVNKQPDIASRQAPPPEPLPPPAKTGTVQPSPPVSTQAPPPASQPKPYPQTNQFTGTKYDVNTWARKANPSVGIVAAGRWGGGAGSYQPGTSTSNNYSQPQQQPQQPPPQSKPKQPAPSTVMNTPPPQQSQQSGYPEFKYKPSPTGVPLNTGTSTMFQYNV